MTTFNESSSLMRTSHNSSPFFMAQIKSSSLFLPNLLHDSPPIPKIQSTDSSLFLKTPPNSFFPNQRVLSIACIGQTNCFPLAAPNCTQVIRVACQTSCPHLFFSFFSRSSESLPLFGEKFPEGLETCLTVGAIKSFKVSEVDLLITFLSIHVRIVL